MSAPQIVGREDDVLLLKQFMKGIGVYGSELKVGGFSGYLAELLVLCYGSFAGVLQAAIRLEAGNVHRPGRASGKKTHDEPLVVVDPVDPNRNVAAALTLDKMFQFAAASRCIPRQSRALISSFRKALGLCPMRSFMVRINERGTS